MTRPIFKIGIDPSLRGFAIVALINNNVDNFLFVSMSNSNIDAADRIASIGYWCDQFLTEYYDLIDFVNIEYPIYKGNAKAFFLHSRVYQQIINLLYENDIVFNEVNPTEVKKSIGKGSLNKEEMQERLLAKNKNLAKDITFFNLNELQGFVDAVVIAEMFNQNMEKQ